MTVDDLKKVDQWVCWDDSNGRKMPISVKGGAASSTDPKTWGSYVSAVECAEVNGYSGIGFVFSKEDKFCGVDLDDCIDDNGFVSETAWGIIDALGSYTEISPSGKGVKIFGRCDKILKGRNRDKIEAYTHGRFFTFTGDIVGDCLDVSDITEWMSANCPRETPTKEQQLNAVADQVPVTAEMIERGRHYLGKCAPCIQGQNGDRQLYSVLSKLVISLGLDKESTIKLVMEDYNYSCDPPWEYHEIERKVDSLLLERPRDPYRLSMYNDLFVKKDEGDDGELIAGVMANRKSDPLPQRFIDNLPPGPIRSMYDYILSTSARDSTGIAFSGALSWYCGLLAGKVMDESGTKTNLYSITLAPSSAGKQAPQDAIRAVTDAAGGSWVSGKVTSDSAIGSVLRNDRNSLCLWDEVGIFFQKSKGGVQGTITDLLLDLWGAANSKFRLKQYADSEKDIVIDKPCFGFHGWSTVDHFWAGLTRMHLRDGFAGRLLVFDTGPRATRKRKVYREPPQELVDVSAYWQGGEPDILDSLGVKKAPDAVMIKVDEEAEEVFDALWDKVESFESDDDQAIWGRAPEKARKIALALACQKGVDVTVNKEHARYACDLVDYLTEKFVDDARRRLTVGDNFTEAKLETVTELKRRDGVMYWGTLLRAVGCSESVFNRVISTLEASGQVAVKSESGGRRKVVYRG